MICRFDGCGLTLRTNNKSGFCKKHHYKTRSALKSKAAWRKGQPREYTATVHHKYIYKKYGMTAEQFDELSKKQNGLCAICNKPPSMAKFRLSVDHCHTSGNVRGLVCSNCNLLLGHARDCVETLIKAINYLSNQQFNKPA